MAAGKARVHELAKELGITSREVLARLKAEGEVVKSASSTVEAPVARRLREAYGLPHPGPRAAGAKDRRRAAGTIPTPLDVAEGKAQRQRTVGAPSAQPKIAGGKGQSSRLTSADTLEIYRSHRLASVSENPSHAIDELFRECEARYGISRSALRQLVANDKLRRFAAGETRVAMAADGAQQNSADTKLGAATQAQRPMLLLASAAQPKSGDARVRRRNSPITPPDALDIYRNYCLAEASANPSQAIAELLRAGEAKYGLSEAGLRRIVAKHRGRVPAPLNRRNEGSIARAQQKLETQQSAGLVGAVQSSLDSDAAVTARPRDRTPGLPQLAATIDLEAVTEIVAGRRDLRDDCEAIHGCLQQLAPNGPGEYGYLTWRYAAVRPDHTDARLTTAHQDLIALAEIGRAHV